MPNKTIAVFLLVFFAKSIFAENTHDTLSYQLSKRDHNCITVTANLMGGASGESVLIAPWESYAHLNNGNFGFHVKEGEIRVVEFHPPFIKLSHNKNIPISVDYEICNTIDGTPHIPIIQDDKFHLFGQNFLLFPIESLDNNVTAIFNFSGFDKKMRIFSDTGESKHFSVNTPIERFVSLQFFGTTQLSEALNERNNKDNMVIVENDSWDLFEKKELTEIAYDLLMMQREKMKDHDFPLYYLFFIREADHLSCKVVSGIHSDRFITLVFPDGPKEKRYKVIYALSHELFHAWLGGTKLLIPTKLQEEYKWFYEGFTDYFGLYFAKASGHLSQSEYLKLLNEYVDQHAGISSNATPVQSQIKGHFLALHFEHLIEKKSLPSDLMFQFIGALIQASSGELKEDIFWNVFNQYFDEDFYTLFIQRIKKETLIDLPPLTGCQVVKVTKEIASQNVEMLNYKLRPSNK